MYKAAEGIRNRILSRREFRPVHFRVLFYIAWRNFVSKKLRSFLTVFGVAIGVSAIFFLLSFGLGMQALVTTQVVGDKSLKAVDVVSPNSKLVKLNEQIVNQMRTFPHVKSVGVQYSLPGAITANRGEVDAVVYGIDQTYQELASLTLTSGRLLNGHDNKSIILNQAAIKAFDIESPSQALGKKISLNVLLENTGAKQNAIVDTYTLVGVVDSGTSNEAYVPSNIFDRLGLANYSQVKVTVDDLTNVDTVRAQIESKGFQTTSLTDTLTEIDNIFKFFNLALIGFGSIGMIVAVLGMFNTLTISLLERTKEIGLMMALGARRRDMRVLFIFEAALISLMGAIIGIGIAYVAGKIVTVFVNLSAASRGVTEWFELFSTPLWAVGSIILITMIIGLVVVYLPARRAERINPIDALQRE